MPDMAALLTVLDREWASRQSDAALLAALGERQEERAFAVLVERHGPMVWGVCRRQLGNSPDAEDAFQATFLVLARKAAIIRDGSQLGGWLHGVASRIARDARRTQHQRRQREQPLRVVPASAPFPGAEAAELAATIDAEVARLPEHYRQVAVRCLLAKQSRSEAAETLGLTEGTLSSRLARAKAMLRDRLTRRGIDLTVGTMTVQASGELLGRTVRLFQVISQSGGSALPAGLGNLMQGGTTVMQWSSWKVLVSIGLLLGAGGWGIVRLVDAQEAGGNPAETSPPMTPGEAKQPLPREVFTYEGMGFADWVRILQTELSPKRRTEAMRALGAFGARGYAKEAVPVMLEVAQEYVPTEHFLDHSKILQAAIAGLLEIGVDAAGPLVDSLKKSETTWPMAIVVLRHLVEAKHIDRSKFEPAVPELIDIYDTFEPTSMFREHILTTLGAFGPVAQKAIPFLEKVRASPGVPEEFVRAAEKALEKIRGD